MSEYERPAVMEGKTQAFVVTGGHSKRSVGSFVCLCVAKLCVYSKTSFQQVCGPGVKS